MKRFWQILSGVVLASTMFVAFALAQPNPTTSFAVMPPGFVGLTVVPDGSGQTFLSASSYIDVYVEDISGIPITTLVASDFEVDAVTPGALADGFNPVGLYDVHPALFTNFLNGNYRIEGTLLAGGFSVNALVKAQGVTLMGRPPLSLRMNSPDTNADGVVNLVDVAFFATTFSGPYDWHIDFTHDGLVNLSDVAVFAGSIGASLPPGFIVDPVD